jgi:adenylate cyclase
MSDSGEHRITLTDIASCFEGVVPAEIATASADGTPNVTHLSRVHMLDDEHVALSNQFFSKTVRNLAENPRACVMVIDPLTYDSFKLIVQYERTERRGPLFELMRRDIDAIAALTGMQNVFKLRSADVYRVVSIDQVLAARHVNDGAPVR